MLLVPRSRVADRGTIVFGSVRPSVCPSTLVCEQTGVNTSTYRLDILDIASMGPNQDWYCKGATSDQ